MTCNEVTFTLSEDTEQDDYDDPTTERHGWSVYIKTPQGSLALNGSEHSDMGFTTADEAIAAVKKWCVDRGFKEPYVHFKVKSVRDE